MRPFRFGAMLLATLSLASCAGSRPDSATCPAVKTGLEPGFAEQLTAMMNTKWNIPRGETREHVAILLLSGGGAWGSYGAGFVNGWSARAETLNEPRPQFDVVTGVSTGAIIAPFAMLGPDFDPVLARSYRGVSSDDLFSGRSVFTLPFWNSLNTAAQLKEKLKAALDDQALAHLRAAATQGRSVWVGAVNFDTGEFSEFNLTNSASTTPPKSARTAIVNRIMAASAIPVFLPPSFIGGCMYLDGGVRENLFIAQIAQSVEKSLAGWRANGETNVDLTFDKWTCEAAQISRQQHAGRHRNTRLRSRRGADTARVPARSLRFCQEERLHPALDQRGRRREWAQPASPGMCKPPRATTDGFDRDFTARLFDAGRRKAMSDPTPWRTDRP